jgi:uncharacterized membrane protein
MGIALALHVLSVVVWVGGMVFAYFCLRPALCDADAKMKTTLWVQVLTRFFRAVFAAVAAILASGLYMIYALGGMHAVGLYVHLMLGFGVVMMLIFLHVYFAPFGRLKRAVARQDFSAAATQVNQIRAFVGTNLYIGLLVIVIATCGRYYLH